jgi:hypothetical protein
MFYGLGSGLIPRDSQIEECATMAISEIRSSIWMIFSAFLLLLALAADPPRLAAQIDAGRVTGTVRDQSGALVPGATVTLTNEDTNVIATVPTTSRGTYVFDVVRVGRYSIQVEHAGFERFVTNDIDVHVQQDANIDATLTLGQVAQKIVVKDETALLQTENAEVGTTIDTLAVNDLPLVNRNWVSLSMLAPGVATWNGGNNSAVLFSANGQHMWQNAYTLNGMDDYSEVYGGPTGSAMIVPPPDAIQEFKIQTGDYSAEIGHSTGAVVNATLKSGTNKLRGNLWEYFRNDALDASDFFSNLNGVPKEKLRQNEFGGTIGGPVFIPHLYDGRNKTFFFFDYQYLKAITPYTATTTVPTGLEQSSGFTNLQDLIAYNSGTYSDALNRVFPQGAVFDPATTRSVAAGATDPISGLANTSGAAIYVRDPFYTGSLAGKTNFADPGDEALMNTLPPGRLDPKAIALLNLYPKQTQPGYNNNYFLAATSPKNVPQFDFRIDETLNQRDSIFFVYDWSRSTSTTPNVLPIPLDGQNGGGNSYGYTYALGGNWVHLFSPTFSNNFHTAFGHQDWGSQPLEANQLNIPEQYGIPGIPQLPGNGGLPLISVSGLAGIGDSGWTPTIITMHNLEIQDNITKIYGAHSFKTGVIVNDILANIVQPVFSHGNFNFGGAYSSIVNTSNGLNGLSDFLIVPSVATVPGGVDYNGGASSISGSNFAPTDDHRWYVAGFFQDNWKVSPTLTLELGLRYDLFTPYQETNGRQVNFIPTGGGNGPNGTLYFPQKTCNTATSPSFPVLLTKDGITVACIGQNTGDYQKKNFGPRIGIAKRFTNRFVARAGFGLTYGALDNIGFGPNIGANYPFLYTVNFNAQNSTTRLQFPNGQAAVLGNGLAPVNIQSPTGVDAEGLSLQGRQFNYQTPYTETYNLTLQYQLTPNDAVQVGYVGNVSRHLTMTGSNNEPDEFLPPGTNNYDYIPYPDFAPFSSWTSTNGASNYNSLQTNYEHRFSHGLSVLGNYTWSHCFSDQSSNGNQNGFRAEFLPGWGVSGEYGTCDSNAFHVVHISGSYQLPFGARRQFLGNANWVANEFIGGWQLNYIVNYQSGQPFTEGCYPLSVTSNFGCNADFVPGQNPYAGPHNQKQWLNPNAFVEPTPVTTINSTQFAALGGANNSLNSPAYTDFDASFSKEFPIHEDVRLQFRAEAFNVLNHTQFASPGSSNYADPATFSIITSLRGQPRILQLALKLYF